MAEPLRVLPYLLLPYTGALVDIDVQVSLRQGEL